MDEDPQGEAPLDEASLDERLLGRLRAAAAHLDPVPDDAVLAARSMLAHLRLDAELAELVFDSEVDRPLVGLRSHTPAARHVTFDAGSAQIDVEVVQEGARRRLVGQCVPATEVALTVYRQDDPGSGSSRVTWAETATDELGRFVVEVPAGPVSLRCVWADGALTAETAWVRV